MTASLHRKELPNYTTERYYLLSEIGEWSDIVTIDEVSNSNNIIGQPYKQTIDVFHFLWNYRKESLSSFVDRTQKSIASLLPEVKKTALVTVQVLTNDSDLKNQQIERDILQLLQYLDSVFFLSQVAVSDRTSSTAALEYGHDWVVNVVTQIGQRQRRGGGGGGRKKIRGRLLVIDKGDCLGLDDREPDAENNVSQALYSSISAEESERLCRAMAESDTSLESDTSVDRVDGSRSPQGAPTTAKSSYILNWVILLVAIAVAASLSGFTTKRQ